MHLAGYGVPPPDEVRDAESQRRRDEDRDENRDEDRGYDERRHEVDWHGVPERSAGRSGTVGRDASTDSGCIWSPPEAHGSCLAPPGGRNPGRSEPQGRSGS